MQQHEYHKFFLPILHKLYQVRDNDEFIEINDCLTGTDVQNWTIVQNLNKSEFAMVRRDIRVINDRELPPPRYTGKILPLGMDYFETYMQEYIKANKKRPTIGFKTKK